MRSTSSLSLLVPITSHPLRQVYYLYLSLCWNWVSEAQMQLVNLVNNFIAQKYFTRSKTCLSFLRKIENRGRTWFALRLSWIWLLFLTCLIPESYWYHKSHQKAHLTNHSHSPITLVSARMSLAQTYTSACQWHTNQISYSFSAQICRKRGIGHCFGCSSLWWCFLMRRELTSFGRSIGLRTSWIGAEIDHL